MASWAEQQCPRVGSMPEMSHSSNEPVAINNGRPYQDTLKPIPFTDSY